MMLGFFVLNSDLKQGRCGAGLLGADDSTKLSAWLAAGCLSPRRVWWEVQRLEESRGGNQSTRMLGFHLLVRDYWRSPPPPPLPLTQMPQVATPRHALCTLPILLSECHFMAHVCDIRYRLARYLELQGPLGRSPDSSAGLL